LSGSISGGSGAEFRLFAKSGEPTNHGTLVISGANTYSGGTLVSQGTLRLSGTNATVGTGNVFVDGISDFVPGQNILGTGKLDIQAGVVNGIADTATVTLTGGTFGGQAILGANISETIGGLVLGGVTQTTPGTYGSTASNAQFKNDLYFSALGTGVLNLVLPITNDADFNNDGTIDAADWVAWRKFNPTATGATQAMGDANGDGDNDAGDEAQWTSTFGQASPASGGSGPVGVPEPTGLMLLLGSSLALASATRRGRK
jgi:autotransporter-associated beta strand protein